MAAGKGVEKRFNPKKQLDTEEAEEIEEAKKNKNPVILWRHIQQVKLIHDLRRCFSLHPLFPLCKML